MQTQDYDWSRFDIYFYYPAPLTDVWRAWATSKGLCSFFLEKCMAEDPNGSQLGDATEFVAGGNYYWQWRHDAWIEGQILSVETQSRLSFTLGSQMQVGLEFVDTGKGIRVHLEQTSIPESDPVGGLRLPTRPQRSSG